jgi:hypothetical protein
MTSRVFDSRKQTCEAGREHRVLPVAAFRALGLLSGLVLIITPPTGMR